MPQGNGLDLIEAVRRLPAERGGLTPAIAMTGGGNIDACFVSGFQHCFEKPLLARPLLKTICSLVCEELAIAATKSDSL
jgi:CheY-like chemotaxis protein